MRDPNEEHQSVLWGGLPGGVRLFRIHCERDLGEDVLEQLVFLVLRHLVFLVLLDGAESSRRQNPPDVKAGDDLADPVGRLQRMKRMQFIL